MKDDILDYFLDSSEGDETFQEEMNKNFEHIAEELDLIESTAMQDFVKAVLSRSIYFWVLGVAPAESEVLGELWPIDTYGDYGDLRNAKRVARAANVLAESSSIEDDEKDALIAAALIHTATKYVFDTKTGKCNFDIMYPYTLGVLLNSIRNDEQINSIEGVPHTLGISDEQTALISRLVRCHRGPWSMIPETVPSTLLESILHMATQVAMNLDYLIDGEEIILERWEY